MGRLPNEGYGKFAIPLLGLCWQGAGEVLQDLLEEFERELREVSQSFSDSYCQTVSEAGSSLVHQ